MHVQRESVTVTTIADGSATAYTGVVTGRILSIIYVKPGSGSYTDGVDFTITTETTGQNLWTDTNVNASETVSPRQGTNGVDGAASLFAAGGAAVQDYIFVANERVKIVIAQGGDTKSGTFYVLVG